ncbi:pyridoxal phosphate-dependent aminotransferase [Candidatus Magnetomorum sp. HK-1]|nr:pyridoxal phosphate-dependent aminotransferase [Candidatus Magnetomorum sp. HK-1]
MKSIPNCIPFISGNELKYLKECIDTGWISPVGPFVDRFEKKFAYYHNLEYATAVSSGTSAIHLGLISLGVKKNDMVLCPTITFIGSVNPIKYVGADPIFIGIEPDSLNIDINSLYDFFKYEVTIKSKTLIYKKNNRRIKCLMVVHLYGNPANMDPIIDLSHKYNLPVLEDAAESLGAKYNNKLVGTIGDVGCFSFNGNKIITTGGGGMVVSKDSTKVLKCKHLSTQAKNDNFEFIHDQIGFNYRLSNLCAAVGLAQMESLDEYIQKKRENAFLYQKQFSNNDNIKILSPDSNCYGTFWMSLASIRNSSDKNNILKKVKSLSDAGIGVRPVWHPIHTMPLYRSYDYYGNELFKQIYDSTFCLPSSVGLSVDEIKKSSEMIINTFN